MNGFSRLEPLGYTLLAAGAGAMLLSSVHALAGAVFHLTDPPSPFARGLLTVLVGAGAATCLAARSDRLWRTRLAAPLDRLAPIYTAVALVVTLTAAATEFSPAIAARLDPLIVCLTLVAIAGPGLLANASNSTVWNASAWLGAWMLASAAASGGSVLLLGIGPENVLLGEGLGQLVAGSAAVSLLALALHLARVPRGPGEAAERWVDGALAVPFRAGVLLGGILPQALWSAPSPGWLRTGLCLASLIGVACAHYAVFRCGPR